MTALGTTETSQLSVQGMSLSVVKSLTDTMEPCSPAAQTLSPVLSLAALVASFSTMALKVGPGLSAPVRRQPSKSGWYSHPMSRSQIQCEEEVTVQWTPGDHMFLYQHVTECKGCWETLSLALGRQEELEAGEKGGGSPEADGGKELSVYLEVGRAQLSAYVTSQNFIVVGATALSLARHAGATHLRSPHLVFNFDGNNIATLTDAELRALPELEEATLLRPSFPFLATGRNRAWVLSVASLALEFPYQYNFSATFDEAIGVQKWLRSLHRAPGAEPVPPEARPLPPDLVFRVAQFGFVFLDDVFEIKLRDNYELMKDEGKESGKRLQLLDRRVAELRKRHGELLPARKIEELYASLERKHIEIYIQRSRRLYANTPMRKALLTWTVSDAEVVVLADRALHGPERVREQLRDIDAASPFPRDGLPLAVQWGRAVRFKLATFLGEMIR